MALDGAARTHPGKARTTNEDALVCRPAAGFFAVVDGMGGEEAGEVAAAIAAQALSEVPDARDLAGETVLSQALRVARDRILHEADADTTRAGMGAVASAVRFDDDGGGVSIAHVGDTRVYLVHQGGVRILTHDHVAEPTPGRKPQVARDLGRRDLQGDWVETSRVRVARGDLLVLCSDGLHDAVEPEALGRELIRLRAEGTPADGVATRLVGMALAAGGPDNVTVVAVCVGRFRRGLHGRVRKRFIAAGVAAAFAAGAAVVAGWPRDRSHDVEIPARVAGEERVGGAGDLEVRAGSRTVIPAGATLRVVGDRLFGGDWSLSVEDGGTAELQRVVVDLDRELTVELAPHGRLVLGDVRVGRGRIHVLGNPSSIVDLQHLSLPNSEALAIEGNPVQTGFEAPALPSPAPAPGGAPPGAGGAPAGTPGLPAPGGAR